MNEKTRQRLTRNSFIIAIISGGGLLIRLLGLYAYRDGGGLILILYLITLLPLIGIILGIISRPIKSRLAISALIINIVVFTAALTTYVYFYNEYLRAHGY